MRRWRLIGAGFAIAIAAAGLILGIVLLSDGDDHRSQVTNGDQSGDAAATPLPTFESQLPETDETVRPAASPPPAVELVAPPSGFSPAVPGRAISECQVDSSTAVLSWKTADPRGDQQVDLTVFDEFVPDHYLSSQILSSDTESLTWSGLIPGAAYFWRVSTRIDDTWVASQTSEFQAEGCPPLDETQASALRRMR